MLSSPCDALRQECQDQGVAFGDLTRLVRESLDGWPPQRPQTETGRPHPIIRSDLIDDRGNLRAADIGITWQGGDTFLHGVQVVGTNEDTQHIRPRPATSTPYSPVREHPPCDMSTPRSTHPVCLESPATPAHRTGQEGRPGYRPAAPIQRFNNKTISWPAWFRHFKAVADVHGWDKDQRALQLVSYLDEKAMNVAQELSDQELYKLLSDRFEPASRGHDSTAGNAAIKRTRTPMLTQLRSRADWDTHRAHRSSARNSSANNSFGDNRTPN